MNKAVSRIQKLKIFQRASIAVIFFAILSVFSSLYASPFNSQESQATLSLGLSETPVAASRASYEKVVFMNLSGSIALPRFGLPWLKEPRVSLNAGISDALGYDNNQSKLSNTTISLTTGSYHFKSLEYYLPISVILPTNLDQRVYDGYRGSIQLRPEITLPSIGIGMQPFASTRLSYHWYAYDVNKGGLFNPMGSYSLEIGFSKASGEKWLFIGRVANTTTILSDGIPSEDLYSAVFAVNYTYSDQWLYGLSLSRNDRTFSHDNKTLNTDFGNDGQNFLTMSMNYQI